MPTWRRRLPGAGMTVPVAESLNGAELAPSWNPDSTVGLHTTIGRPSASVLRIRPFETRAYGPFRSFDEPMTTPNLLPPLPETVSSFQLPSPAQARKLEAPFGPVRLTRNLARALPATATLDLLSKPLVGAPSLLVATKTATVRFAPAFPGLFLPSLIESPKTAALAPIGAPVTVTSPLAMNHTAGALEFGFEGLETENAGHLFGLPRTLGKQYVDGSARRDVQKLAESRQAEQLKRAVKQPRQYSFILPVDPFELVRPILMPPLSDEQYDVLLMPKELYGYQRYGVKWLLDDPARLLADDMGLGKTAQAITAFRAIVRQGQGLSALVVCPTSLVENWTREFGRWAPELRVFRMDGLSEQERQLAWPVVRNAYHVVITTYDRLRKDALTVRKATASRPFSVAIFDEIQYLKNLSSDRRKAANEVRADRRWGLSGTPLENSLDELKSVVSLLTQQNIEPGHERTALARVMLRRKKSDSDLDLPELIRNKIYLDLTHGQRTAYVKAERDGVADLKSLGEVRLTNVLALIGALKLICNGIPGSSCKTDFVADYLDEVSSNNEKALLFSQYKQHFSSLSNDLRAHGPLAYSGSLSAKEREAALAAFKSTPSHRVLLMTLGAGSVGLNITEANHVIHYDSWWNPARGSQATARAHRLGQSRRVIETTLICTDTIEERIDAILQQKRDLFRDVVDDLSDEKLASVLSEREFYGLFGLEPPRRS